MQIFSFHFLRDMSCAALAISYELPDPSLEQANVGDMGVIAEITDIEFLADGRAHLQVCRLLPKA